MTVSTTISRWEYLGDGATTAFSFDNIVFAAADLAVYVDGARVYGFTVTGLDAVGGGNVILASAPPSGVSVVLVRKVAATQDIEFPEANAIPSRVLSKGLDKLTVLIQQLEASSTRKLGLSDSSTYAGSLDLPDPVPGRAVKWAPDGLSLVNSDVDPDGQVNAAAAYAQTAAAAAATAALARDAAGLARDGADLAQGSAAAAAAAAELARDQAQAAVIGNLARDGSNAMTAPLRLTMVATPAAPIAGEVKVYAKPDGKLYRQDVTSGERSIGGGPSLGTDSIIRTNAQTISENITFPAATNGMSAGPIAIAAGYTVEIPTGSYWSIV